ncbi:DUF7149 domain-containing protein [Nitratiruptor tergarcus]|uniref:site-specific DNA-methyltransferase (adenine-specific) n=1 Tax=Nitratiruptor tergarcus DSM 16512 TaxID=1069081 RepID=A0A1W1WS57_9BACT|nr:TaqI-like C-terminal specificity domain-containing protein [Nitratiruptor tergarcus]SMC09076.1 Type II restriction/modification system, DNA methylase subunit YeeA [Nitratiruptor tergarcus DSM 16512]
MLQIKIFPPRKVFSPLYSKKSITKSALHNFDDILKRYLDNLHEQIKMQQTEPVMVSSVLKPFFDSMHYDAQSFSQKGQSGIDLALMHDGKPAVILEAKRPDSSANISQSDPNKKALHEAILYFMRERDQDNYNLYHIIITNFYQWYIFDAKEFDKLFWQNKEIRKIYENIKNPSTLIDKTKEFYKLLQNKLSKQDITIEAAYVDLQKPMSESQKAALYKLFSKKYLFKTFNPNDANKLDRGFYNELLYILGLEEKKVGGKKIIDRATTPHMASLYENIARNLEYTGYRANFEIVLQLLIIWMNRILFMKLLEAQLLQWNSGEERYKFLHIQTIKDFDVLKIFFFDILARPQHKRVHKEYEHIPYLNSSLFEISPVEKEYIDISNLEDNCELPYYSKTVLRDENGKRRKGSCNMLQYLFEFLDAYDFSSEGMEEITKDNKTLINAAVLGLIFEKLNGYKEGSYYTPSFVTMYMARETIERAIIKKFNTLKGWKCKTLGDLDEKIEDKKEANEIINSLTICDPAVGSGHFLVSALNTILAIKSELRLLYDVQGKRIKDYILEVENDELIIRDDEGEIFEYRRGSQEGYRIQRAIFEEKKRIIENSLFGVDINPNAAHIARLRLWIELLKHSYYDENGQLVTMPNIDINIKVGNSLVSRYGLHDEITIPNIQYEIEKYKKLVREYKDGIFEGTKEQMQESIERLKEMFGQTLQEQWKQKQTYKKKLKEYVQDYGFDGLRDEMMLDAIQFGYGRQGILFVKENDDAKKQKRFLQEIEEIYQQIEEIRLGRVYENAFEWRFEFPEVLDEEGNFVGFNVILGNPPYISLSKLKGIDYALFGYQAYDKRGDILALFVEKSLSLINKQGIVSLITSNSWLKTRYGEVLKKILENSGRSVNVLDFEDTQIFDEATVETCIITIGSEENPSFQVVNIRKFDVQNATVQTLQDTIERFARSGAKEAALMRRIEKQGIPLGERDISINYGIKTGYNKAFIIDAATKNRLVEQDPKSAELLKPLIRGRDVYKYKINWAGMWLINTHNNPPVDVEQYPAIKAYLDQFYEKLVKRKDQGNTPYNLRNCAYLDDFEKPKIVWGEISDKPKFAYDDEGFYVEATGFIMIGNDLKFLLGILNSKLSKWYFEHISTTTGMGTNRWKKFKLEQLPIVKCDDKDDFITIVDQIIQKKKSGEDTKELEDKIDAMIYDLYNLTQEEKELIEKSVIQ